MPSASIQALTVSRIGFVSTPPQSVITPRTPGRALDWPADRLAGLAGPAWAGTFSAGTFSAGPLSAGTFSMVGDPVLAVIVAPEQAAGRVQERFGSKCSAVIPAPTPHDNSPWMPSRPAPRSAQIG